MEYSDDSFVWTSASSDTNDSDFKGNNMSSTIRTKVEDGDSTDNKKKLQKRLFAAEEPGSNEEEPPRKRKKLKREREKTLGSPRVKRELESDAEAEAELARRVKQEQLSDHATLADTNGINHDPTLTSESNTFTNNDKKSKKSKKKKRKSSLNTDVKDMIVEDMFSAEETVVEERQRKLSKDFSPRRQNSISKKSIDTDIDYGITHSSEELVKHDSSSYENSERKKKKKKEKRKRNSEPLEIEQIGNGTDDIDSHEQETSFQSTKSSNKKSIISDRIRFEEDNESTTENQNNAVDLAVNTATESHRLKRFIKSKPTLKVVSPSGGSHSLITQDDEVWVIKCPHEIDICNLRGKDLNLDTKCKLKIDGRTYDGSLNEDGGSVAILSYANNKIIINNVSIMGTVNFHKRIPKPHFVDDNMMILNNQTNFIPLPDTKCRHPLFGSDYKKAIKIPSAIKQRLKGESEPQQVLIEKKKKKRHIDQEYVEEPVLTVHKSHKKKKHRQMSAGEDDEPPRKKAKKMKIEVSAETWESEKAIEASLFNF